MHILTENPSIAHHIIHQLRDRNEQLEPWRFRRNLEKLGELLAYELSKTLHYQEITTTTVLGESKGWKITDEIVLMTIMRAGIPFFQGFLNVFKHAECAFIGAYRANETEEGADKVTINSEYIASPKLHGKTLVLIDPMLATGKSLVSTINQLDSYGKPTSLHIAAAIGSEPGIRYVQDKIPEAILWLGALDKELNHNAYIVPGLGDAGDLSYGGKWHP